MAMNPYLAGLYNTHGFRDKVASDQRQAEEVVLFNKLAAQQGIDLATLSDEQTAELWNNWQAELHKLGEDEKHPPSDEEEEEKSEEEKKAAILAAYQQKVATDEMLAMNDLQGRAMAHALWDELGEIYKDAALKDSLKGVGDKLKGVGSKIQAAGGKVRDRFGKAPPPAPPPPPKTTMDKVREGYHSAVEKGRNAAHSVAEKGRSAVEKGRQAWTSTKEHANAAVEKARPYAGHAGAAAGGAAVGAAAGALGASMAGGKGGHKKKAADQQVLDEAALVRAMEIVGEENGLRMEKGAEYWDPDWVLEQLSGALYEDVPSPKLASYPGDLDADGIVGIRALELLENIGFDIKWEF